ncbi:uncharacterized protein LOC144872408 [Branchiostoma floridae x Branchiostoma japonicum]
MATRLLLTFGVVFLVGRTVSTEVVSDDNVALGKPAFQTSTWGPGEPSRAVDGRTSPRMDAGSCTHTAGHPGEDNPTWWVDLGQSYAVDSVVIFNRMDSWSERLNPFNILIGDSDQVSTNPQCGGDHQIDLAKPFISVSCQGMRGRFVAVRLPGSSRILTLCEVRVFAGGNVALGKPAFQTSTYVDGGAANRAVDGRSITNFHSRTCTHTKQEDNPAWWVDLGQPYVIESVVIVNRQDCCSERLNPFNILIGDSDQVSTNPQCGGDHQIGLTQPSISVSCPGMRGRYVAVRLPGSSRILTLCEVRVFTVNAAGEHQTLTISCSAGQTMKLVTSREVCNDDSETCDSPSSLEVEYTCAAEAPARRGLEDHEVDSNKERLAEEARGLLQLLRGKQDENALRRREFGGHDVARDSESTEEYDVDDADFTK